AVPGAAGLTTDHPAFYAQELQEYVEETLDQEERISLLAHSMGGLVSRHYVEELEGGDYVDSLVTLGTPHQGSLLAYMGGHTRGGRAMQPGSEFLENLNDDIAEDVDYTVVWSEDDRMIQPSTYGRMPVDADNVDEIHVDVGDPFDLFAPPGTNHLRLMEPDVYKTYRHHL
ncbi:MAG: alpha/beta fold hydrolase, partial [Candidatus Nanohaloarchaea archaeon]|nr:alpha/beta fold hydrolase [Candidatus Nanohaloarchaea archaeon]